MSLKSDIREGLLEAQAYEQGYAQGQKDSLDKAVQKFESCAYGSCDRHGTSHCSLDGYAILDCPHCKSYKLRAKRKEVGDG